MTSASIRLMAAMFGISSPRASVRFSSKGLPILQELLRFANGTVVPAVERIEDVEKVEARGSCTGTLEQWSLADSVPYPRCNACCDLLAVPRNELLRRS